MQVALPDWSIRWSAVNLLRFVPDVWMSLALVLILVALARPQRNLERIEQYSDGIDLMLILDISESMLLEDLQPNRLEAAKRVARNFINVRRQDRIGIVVFSGDAFSLSPLTTDYQLLNQYVNDITHQMIRAEGTAIGSALAVAVNRMRESAAKSKVGILISDGDNTAGNIDPVTAAQLAKVYGIKLYTVVVGTDGKLPFKDERGNVRYVENTVDEQTLREIARIGEGRFFRASDSRALQEVFGQINVLEKSEIKESRFINTKDYYQIYLRWAIVCWLLWLLTKSTFVSNVLED